MESCDCSVEGAGENIGNNSCIVDHRNQDCPLPCNLLTLIISSKDEVSNHLSGDGDHQRSVGEFRIPEDSLRVKIIQQVEYYFSDKNILKDAFLLKHVRRHKFGYVNIKLIATFKKLKSLSSDYRVVAHCLRNSDVLEVNDTGLKVRRKNPLPDYDETVPSRTLVVINLPPEHNTIESVAELFCKCGDVVLIRILRPGKTVPADIKKYVFMREEIMTTVCAVIGFESHEHAKAAYSFIGSSNIMKQGMRVTILRDIKTKSIVEKSRSDAIPYEGGVDLQKKKNYTNKHKSHASYVTVRQTDCCSSTSNSKGNQDQQQSLDSNSNASGLLCLSNFSCRQNSCEEQLPSRNEMAQTKRIASRTLHPGKCQSGHVANKAYGNTGTEQRYGPVKNAIDTYQNNSYVVYVMRQPHGPRDFYGFHRGKGRGNNYKDTAF